MVHDGIQTEGVAGGSWVRRSIAILAAAVVGAVLVSCAPASGSTGPAGPAQATPSARAAAPETTSSTTDIALPTAPKSPREQTIPVTPTRQPVAPHVVKTSSNTVEVLTVTNVSIWTDQIYKYTHVEKCYTPVTTVTYYYSDGHRVQGRPINGKPFSNWTRTAAPIIDFEHPIPISPATGPPPSTTRPPRVDPPQPTGTTAPMLPR
jgi:hypothetical protein